MRRVIYIVTLLAFCTGARAQDKEVKRHVDSMLQSADLDTSVISDEFEPEAEDSAVATTENTTTTIEQKIRDKEIPHSLWDEQAPGVWNDEAQGRLSKQAVPEDKMTALRNIKALQYNKPPPDKNAWWMGLGAWVTSNFVAIRNIFYILLGGLLLAVIILFIRKNDIAFFRRSHQQHTEAEVITEQGPQNYDALAKAAIAAGNWREAVRMRYLQSLQLLEARQLIAPGKDKTNMDYLRELSSTTWHKPFATLTLHYEYIWYGQQPLNNGQFAHLEDQFSAFKKSLR